VIAPVRVDLALIGFGHVGQRFAALLDERRTVLIGDEGLDCRVVGFATRHHGGAFNLQGIDCAQAARAPIATGTSASSLQIIEQLARSPADLRVVVETTTLDIEAGQPAIDHVRSAIAAGCHVITANKGPAAFAFAALDEEAAAAGVNFLFEGAVMDGVPVFNLVRETLPALTVLGFRGVVNSTTNHILTAMEKGEGFDAALARMQAEGIAEADASLDVDGWDAAAKTAALANVLLAAGTTPQAVHRTGIRPSDGARARRARENGRRLKLVASARRDGDGDVSARVEPVELLASDLLAGLDGKANALVLETDLLGEIAICQLAGSLTHTAYALLSDLVTIGRRQALRAAPARRTP
jgi:homoserine dehydrogenase